jgi:predicted ATP-grasp superfamily ATP-dependent carboligase
MVRAAGTTSTEEPVLDPGSLYRLTDDVPQDLLPGRVGRPMVLVHALQGFVDAGSAATIVGQHLLDTLEHQVVATFEVDELIDYRSRRPTMVYDHDHYASFQAPRLQLHAVQDAKNEWFLLLTGPEPDVQWERFVAAVRQLVEHFAVTTTVGLHGIGMAVPHTRPVGVIAHANRTELVPPSESWPGSVPIPGSAAGLLELRLGEWGHDALGFVVQVPHYLAETPYPEAAVVLMDRLVAFAGLTVSGEVLQQAAQKTRDAIADQVADSEEVARVVAALEEQYDAMAGSRERAGLLSPVDLPLPSADELGAEVERFLAAERKEGWFDPPSDGGDR